MRTTASPLTRHGQLEKQNEMQYYMITSLSSPNHIGFSMEIWRLRKPFQASCTNLNALYQTSLTTLQNFITRIMKMKHTVITAAVYKGNLVMESDNEENKLRLLNYTHRTPNGPTLTLSLQKNSLWNAGHLQIQLLAHGFPKP